MQAPATIKSELRVCEYRARAEQASIAAEGATLQNTRDRHRQAAAIWTGLADAEQKRAASARAAMSAVARANAKPGSPTFSR